MKEVKVSILIPAYNVEYYIRDCLDSVIRQSLKDIEIICIDDGSTDGTLDIIRKYGSSDSRIKVISRENRGIAASRNECLHHASGEYIYFLDSDDVISTDAMEKLYTIAAKNDLDLVSFEAGVEFCDQEMERRHKAMIGYYTRRITIDGIVTGIDFLLLSIINNDLIAPLSTYFYKRKFICNNNILCRPYMHEDEDYTIQVLLAAERCIVIHDKLYTRMVRKGSETTQIRFMRSSYGYYRNALSLFGYIFGTVYPEEFCSVLAIRLSNLLRLSKNKYKSASDDQKKMFLNSLSPEDETMFRCLIGGPSDASEEIAALKGALDKEREKSKQLSRDIKRLKKEIKKIRSSKRYVLGSKIADAFHIFK